MMLFNRMKSPMVRGTAIGVITAVVCLLISRWDIVRDLENWALDGSYLYRGVRESETRDDIVIVAIDDETLGGIDKPLMYLSPELASIVAYVRASGSSVVGLDLLIPAAVESFDDLGPGRPGDTGQIAAVAAADPFLVFPVLSLPDGELRPVSDWSYGEFPEGVDRPWYEFAFVNTSPDPDMTLRVQTPALRSSDLSIMPSFAFAVFGASQTNPDAWKIDAAGQTAFRLEGELDKRRLRINYCGPTGTFERRSFLTVLQRARAFEERGFSPSSEDTDEWTDKIVLIGTTSPSLGDAHPTPFVNQSLNRLLATRQTPQLMPGVEVHANVIATLADAAFITTPVFLSLPVTLLVTGIILGIALLRTSLELGVLLTFAHHWLWKLFCFAAFDAYSWRVEMVPVLLLGMLVFSVVFAMRWRWIRRMLGMIKSEAIARALEADPSKMDLRGEDRVITVLFSDIRGFTSYSETRSPREVVNMLNAYFGAVVPVLEKHGGVVNQYVGDGVMVLFGAPEVSPQHALQAVQAGVAMIEEVHRNGPLWERLGAPEFRIGVGIHTGRVVLGTVGSKNRLDYTAIGDTTNTAARIESANKDMGTELLISDSTFAQLVKLDPTQRARVGSPHQLRAKGRQSTVMVHEIAVGSRRTGSGPVEAS